jgi:hypothetical protein
MGCLRVISPTLRSIATHDSENYMPKMVIDDAPCLERRLLPFYPQKGSLTVQVVRAPKLNILGPYSMRQIFQVAAKTSIPHSYTHIIVF